MGEAVATPISAELERLKLREQALAFDAAEKTLAEKLGETFAVLKPRFDSEAAELFGSFSKWAAERGVRSCAAKPATVAAFILAQAELGAADDKILGTLVAIEAVHDYHGLPNPTATAVVKAALDRAMKTEPPRSWPKADKVLFATLPADIRKVIAKREAQRETWLRQAQNERAKEKENGKHLRQSDAA